MEEYSPHPPHIQYALLAGITSLEQLVWNFQQINDEVDRRGHAYRDVKEPTYWISIIDGYLLNERSNLPGGNIAQLERIRVYLQEHLVVAYEAGRASARQKWLELPSEERSKIANFDFDYNFRDEAKRSAPEKYSATEQGWFIEAFSKTWQELRMEYNRELYDRGKEEQE